MLRKHSTKYIKEKRESELSMTTADVRYVENASGGYEGVHMEKSWFETLKHKRKKNG